MRSHANDWLSGLGVLCEVYHGKSATFYIICVRFKSVVSGKACEIKTTISDYNLMVRHKDSSESKGKIQSWTHVIINTTRQLSRSKWTHLEAKYKYANPYIPSSPSFCLFDETIYFSWKSFNFVIYIK